MLGACFRREIARGLHSVIGGSVWRGGFNQPMPSSCLCADQAHRQVQPPDQPTGGQAVPRSDRAKGGRPSFDHVLMFKTLVLQTSHNLSDERTEYLIRDRLSFMRFLGLDLADTVPDANTIWTFREALTRARLAGKPAIEALFERFDGALSVAGFLAMSGQIIDASSAPNT